MGHAAEVLAPEMRASRRTNLLLAASIEFNGLHVQVRIRNVSETGALIEGPQLPPKGARLHLHRAGLQIASTVAWAGGGKAGIHFDELVSVEAWSGVKPKPIELSGLRDQRRVDAIQSAVRAGLSTTSFETSSEPADGQDELKTRIAEELNYVARLIESMSDELSASPAVLSKHAKCLQTTDLANQILADLAGVIGAENPHAKVAEIGMSDLRARLTRKSLLPPCGERVSS